MFSYIVTGVFFVYNDSIMIIFSILAVFGAYALLRELVMLFGRKKRAVAAVRIRADMDANACTDAVRFVELLSQSNRQLESAPVLLCDAPVPKDLQNYGYEIYVRQTDTEEECRRN